ncbi:MAG TPA: glycosyltransferase family 4 protein [Chitinophagales bacterium]|nr:glycosyltransferase family 4 protein [Chitinophagales bacterium]HRX22677.1 glycosyltransferase family 4 protein [Chitinophagales bacterium]
MRILLVTKKSPFPSRDGEAIALRNMMDQYLMLGWQVDMLCMITPKHPYRIADQPEQATYNMVRFTEVYADTSPGKWSGLLNLLGKWSYHMQRFDQPAFRQALAVLLQERNYDVVQLEGLFMLNYLSVIRLKSSARIIYRSHNIEGNIWKRLAMQEAGIWKKWYLRIQADRLLEAERHLQDQVDFILSISVSDVSAYRQYSPKKKIAYLPTGFDFPEPGPPPIRPDIYFIGALDWMPNIQGLRRFLQEAWPVVLETHPDAKLYVAGRHAPVRFEEELPDGVSYLGEIEDASRFVHDHAICIVPLWAGSGLKIKIVEALATGKPLVTTPVGMEGLPSGLEEFVIVEQDTGKMARRLAGWITDWPVPAEMAGRASQLVRHTLSNEAVQGQLKTILRQWNLA